MTVAVKSTTPLVVASIADIKACRQLRNERVMLIEDVPEPGVHSLLERGVHERLLYAIEPDALAVEPSTS